MILPGHDHRGLGIAEGPDLLQGLDIERDVHRPVDQTRLVQSAVGSAALHAVGLGVDDDRHIGHFLGFRWRAGRITPQGDRAGVTTHLSFAEGHGGPARQDTTPRGPPGPPPQHAVSGADLCTMTSSPVDSSGTACGGTVDSRPARLGAPSRGSRSDPQNHGPAGV